MRKCRIIILFLLYLSVCIFTIVMEYLSIHNQGIRLLINGSTLLMVIVSGILFWILYRGLETDRVEGKTDKNRECEKQEFIFDKQIYIKYANEHELSRRETEIGLLVLQDYTNLQIAETLYIAETTVKKHLTHIYEKTGTGGRKEFKETVRKEMKVK